MSNKTIFLIAGIMVGLIGPPVAMYSFYYFNYRSIEFQVFIDRLLYSTLFAPVLSLCVLINLLLFFSFIWVNKDEGAKGVLFATILYAFVILGMKLF